MLDDKQYRKSFINDPSLWILLFSNLATIFFATKEGWNLSTIMWVYWFQSITIGFFNFIRILQLREFSTEGVEINEQPIQSTQNTKNFIAFFFLFHYGLFHAAYLIFLLTGVAAASDGRGAGHIEWNYILLPALFFFISHFFSYFYNKPRDTKKQNISSLMFYPYARVIPMHFTIILGSSIVGALPFFLALKTFADCIMHIIEHTIIRKGEDREM